MSFETTNTSPCGCGKSGNDFCNYCKIFENRVRKIIFFAFLLAFLFGLLLYNNTCNAQPTFVTLTTGTNGYVTINNNDFERGVVFSQYRYSDSTLCLIYSNTRTRFCAPLDRKHFWNGDTNDSFYTFVAVIAWWTAHGQPIQGTATIDIGDPVTGGTNLYDLYISGTGLLANKAPFYIIVDSLNGGNTNDTITTATSFTNLVAVLGNSKDAVTDSLGLAMPFWGVKVNSTKIAIKRNIATKSGTKNVIVTYVIR